MNLLETVLRSCESQEYEPNFKNNGIDSFTLKILNDEDLQLIGIEDENKRRELLKHIQNLQIPTERKVDTTVGNQYVLLVLNEISLQLHKHFANLTYALKREDVDLCDIEVTPAVISLQNSLQSLETELHRFEEKTLQHKKKRRRLGFHILFPTIMATGLALLVYRNYILFSK